MAGAPGFSILRDLHAASQSDILLTFELGVAQASAAKAHDFGGHTFFGGHSDLFKQRTYCDRAGSLKRRRTNRRSLHGQAALFAAPLYS